MTVLLKRFGDRTMSPLGAALFMLLTNKDVLPESWTAGLLQQHVSYYASKPVHNSTNSLAACIISRGGLYKEEEYQEYR